MDDGETGVEGDRSTAVAVASSGGLFRRRHCEALLREVRAGELRCDWK